MTRHLFVLPLLGLLLLPDWATAFGRRRACSPPAPVAACYPPVVFVPTAPLVYYPAAPVAQAAPAARADAIPAPADRPTAGASAKPPEEVKPTRFADPEPAIPPTLTPNPLPTAPTPAAPRPIEMAPPPLRIDPPSFPSTSPKPDTTPPAPTTPRLQLPTPGGEPRPTTPPPPGGLRIPPPSPAVPGDPSAPVLRLPSTLPGPGDLPATSESRSSPLTGAESPSVEVFPVDGDATDGPRQVGFYNHADRDVTLTVQGKTVTLPKRHHVRATVPAVFRWSIDGGQERATVIPPDAPGVEVVFGK